MDESIMQKVRLTLTNYLEENHCRKTPERYAILDAIYSINGQRLNSLQKGVNILRYSDGTVRKVVIK